MDSPKKVDFSKFRFVNRFKNDKEQRKLLVGKPLFSFIHFIMVNQIKDDRIVSSSIFPEYMFDDGKKFTTIDSEFVPGASVYEYVTPKKTIEYKILERANQQDKSILYFVKERDHIKLYSKITQLNADSPISFLRTGGKEFIHDDKTGVYYPFRVINVKI